MDALNEPHAKVNGKFLAQYTGKPVAIIGKIISVHPNGASFEMKSADNMVINAIMSQPLDEPLEGWLEVRGTAQGKCHVIVKHYTPLHSPAMANFDVEMYDDIITVINTRENSWTNV